MAKRNGIHLTTTILAILAIAAIVAYAIFGGSKKREIVGTWVTDTCAIESGFQCGTRGIAASINYATRQYNSWEIHNNDLILKGKLFNNRRVTDIADTMAIKKLSSKTLVVEQNGKTVQYKRIR